MEAMTPQAEADRAAFKAALEAGLAAYNGVPDSHSHNVVNVVRAAITAYQAALCTPSASGWALAIEAAAKVCDKRKRAAEITADMLQGNTARLLNAERQEAFRAAADDIRALSPAAAMEDSALVERVAEAICNSRDDNWFSHPLLGHEPGECSTCDAEREGWLNAARAALAVIQGQGGLRPFVRRDDTVERVAAEKALREIHKLAVHRGTFASVDTRMEHAEHALTRIAELSRLPEEK